MPEEVGPPNGVSTPKRCLASAMSASSQRAKRVRTSRNARARVCAAFDCTNLRIILPTRLARRWASSDDVGIEAAQDVGGGISGEQLQVLIEKDFACLDHPEDNADAYPNPAQGNACPT